MFSKKYYAIILKKMKGVQYHGRFSEMMHLCQLKTNDINTA